MTLFDAIQKAADSAKEFPNGFDFTTKTKLLGISHAELGNVGKATISLEMITSDQWGISFQPMDKEFISALKGLFEHLGGRQPTQKEIDESAINHPCRESCSGWNMGFDRGRFESKLDIDFLLGQCKWLAKQKSRQMRIDVIKFIEKRFEDRT